MRVSKRTTRIGLAFAAFLIGLSLWNASWLAPAPQGKPKLIAHRGMYHLYDKRAAFGRDTCSARPAAC